MMKIFNDGFGNVAIIDEVRTLPYCGATSKEKGYRLSLYASYDNDFLYFLSIFETEQDAINKMREFSCDTWKRYNK